MLPIIRIKWKGNNMAKVKVYKKGVLTMIEQEYAELLVKGDENFSFDPPPEVDVTEEVKEEVKEEIIDNGPDGRKLGVPPEEEEEVEEEAFDEETEADKKASLMEAYSVKFGKDAPPNIKIETLEAKLLEAKLLENNE